MTAFTDEGPDAGTPLVLLHSIGTSGALWHDVAVMLSAVRRVIRVDFRGHGAAPATPGAYTLDLLARDVLGVLGQLDVHRAHVAGVSLGGMVAQQLAADAPARVASLMLVDTALRVPPESLWRERAALVRAHGMAPLADTAVTRWVTDGASEATRAALRAILLATDPQGYAGAAEAIADADLTAAAHTIEAKTLVLVGDADVATPPAMAEALRDAIPGATLQVIAGAAHLPMAEQPEAVAAALAAFMAG